MTTDFKKRATTPEEEEEQPSQSLELENDSQEPIHDDNEETIRNNRFSILQSSGKNLKILFANNHTINPFL